MPDMTPAIYSHNLNAKGQMYFFDVREAKNGSKYLNITQSWTAKDGQKKRNTLTIFANGLPEFADTVSQMQEKIQ